MSWALVIGEPLRCHLAGHLSSHASPAEQGPAGQADYCVSLYASCGV